jgi:hypothetical protein
LATGSGCFVRNSFDRRHGQINMIFLQRAWLRFLSMGIACILHADTVLLTNFDCLTGQIQKLENKHLYLKTAYAGVVEIDWSMVQGISSDQALQFSMRGQKSD